MCSAFPNFQTKQSMYHTPHLQPYAVGNVGINLRSYARESVEDHSPALDFWPDPADLARQ